jgi:hypothetical protein
MNLNDDVVYRCLRLGPLHQLHPGRSRSLVRHNDCLHRLPPCVGQNRIAQDLGRAGLDAECRMAAPQMLP